MLKVSRNLYCFELFRFNNIPIIYKDKQSLRLKSSSFSFHTITNENLLKKIESKLKELYNDTRVVNLYLIDLIYGKSFSFFAIEFESELFKNDNNISAYHINILTKNIIILECSSKKWMRLIVFRIL